MIINKLKLFTRNLNEQKEFYKFILELELLEETTDSFSVKVGESILTFVQGDDNPFYHFAFNIPSFQIHESYEWIKQKIDTLTYEGKDIIRFDSWNAEALYFYDADKNLVEFIARKNLNLVSQEKFSKENILYISEIGIPTLDISKVFNTLNNESGLEIYDGDFESFCAIGNETGLFIVMNYLVKKWMPTMEEGKPSPFEIVFDNSHGEIFTLIYKNEEIKIIKDVR
ncbi:MAG: VOC family protein [Ignavibacteriales bacterium]|nr:VOC family protein [Ignavibacteriales bacterium]